MNPNSANTYSFGCELDISDREIVELYAFQREFGFWTSSSDGKSGVLSSEICSILEIELKSDSVPSEVIINSVYSEDRLRIFETMRLSAIAKEPFEYTYRIPKPDGSLKVVRTSGDSRYRPDGTSEMYGITFTLFPNARSVGIVDAV